MTDQEQQDKMHRFLYGILSVFVGIVFVGILISILTTKFLTGVSYVR